MLLLFTSLWLSPAAATAAPVYGSVDPAFWFPLSEFERQSLATIGTSQQGNPETLLRISLMGAGIREERDYRRYHRKIKDFFDHIEPELAKAEKAGERGRLLFEKMHSLLMLPTSRNGRLYGYNLEQSSLAELLDTGRFNCTSSALLYVVLAAYLDLEVRGAVVPNHVFVELGTGKGAWVAIETTSADGFGKIHNREFYLKQADGWASLRGLEPVTYDDYLHRQFITPLKLAAMNMDDQHVRRGGMTEEDRLRLKEAQSLVMADDKTMQIQRLGLYNNEYNRLSGKGDFRTLVEMFRTVEPVIKGIEARWPNDPDLAEMLSWLYYQEADSFYRAGDPAGVLPLMNRSLDLHKRSGKGNDPRVRDNNLGLLAMMVKDLLAKGLFNEARDLSDHFSDRFRTEAGLGQIYRMIYSRWGLYHWQRQEWDPALDILKEELAFVSGDDQEFGRLLDLISDCYLNRGASALKGNNWQQAIDFYKEGYSWAQANAPGRIADFREAIAGSYQELVLSNFNRGNWAAAVDDSVSQRDWADDPGMRSSIDRNLQAAFSNWKTDYLRKGDLAGAKRVLRKCIERFPAFESCREQLGELEQIHPR